jgi:hypothetical protein
MNRWRIALLTGLVILLSPHRMWAWGCVGHQVVAYIASQNLNPQAAKQVADLLSDAPYGGYHRFCSPTNLGKIEYFATWADDARTDDNAGWHFWDIPLAVKSTAVPTFCGDSGCVVSALKAKVAVLNSPTASRADKQTALLFVIHLIGDAHQPMHIVDNGDRGGNCVPVDFDITGYSHKTAEKKLHGQGTGSFSPNLHAVWDDNVIQTMTGLQNDSNRDELTQAFADSVAAEYASAIHDALAKPTDLTSEIDFQSWALAAHQLAGPNSYARLPTDVPVVKNPQTLKSCAGVSDRLAALHETIDEDFVQNAQNVIRSQIALGGAHLAATLNTIWPAN